VAHDDIIGRPEGVAISSTKGSELVAMRPRLADYVLRMERGPAVLYPKDAAAFLVWGDVGLGHTVVEAGTGSGALTMVLTRAVGAEGRVVSVELRQDHANLAKKRIETFFGKIPSQLELRVGDVVDVIDEIAPDRIVLDLPEPWHAVEPAARSMPGGGVFSCYLPTVPQVESVRRAIAGSGAFVEVSTFETMIRDWVVDGRSVRPSHRMIGHTGFITVARRRLLG
jgi:tRNA (adenine57-N1/adenine58-N1)-methyltransferase